MPDITTKIDKECFETISRHLCALYYTRRILFFSFCI